MRKENKRYLTAAWGTAFLAGIGHFLTSHVVFGVLVGLAFVAALVIIYIDNKQQD